jgi:tetratricopeptide (TPR) repeat protein
MQCYKVCFVSILLCAVLTGASAMQTRDGSQSQPTIASGVPQIPSDCRSSKETSPEIAVLLQTLASSPNAEVFSGLGTLYGRNAQFHCAVAAFEAALTLAPAAQTRYNLAFALIQDHQPRRAARELRAVLAEQPNSFAAHNALGLALQDLGATDEAAEEFKTALKANPRYALADYDLAQLLSSQGSYRAAAYYLKEGLATSPVPELALQMKAALAVAYAQLGQYADSIPLFQEVVAANPQAVDPHFDLATAYAHRENYIDAVKEYKEVLRIDPNRIEAELLLAKALLNQSNVEACLPYLRDYAGRKPKDPEGLEVLGDALKESPSHLSEAIEVLQRAVAANPRSYKAQYDLGVVLGRSGHLEDAIRALQTAVKLKPEGSEARYQLAQILRKAKHDSAAKEQFAAFERLKDEDQRRAKAVFLSNHGNDLLREGRDRQAVEAYREALAITNSDPKLHYSVAIALARTGDRTGEHRELAEALKLDPKFAAAHNQLGSLHLREGRPVDAEREFRAALASDPQSAEALNNLGTALGRQGKSRDAEQVFRRAVDLDPEAPLGFVNLGLTFASEKKYVEAEQEFRRAVMLDGNNAEALTALGMLQGKTGRARESVETFRKLVALEPASADAHLNLGIALADTNDLEGALAQFSEAVRLAPSSPPAEYNRGRVLYALHRPEEARQSLEVAVKLSPEYVDAMLLLGIIEHTSPRATQLFRRVVELEPSNAQAHFYLGRNLLQEGRRAEAIAEWKIAVKLEPDNVSALSSLARILTQDKSPDAGQYMAQLQTLQQKQQLTDRVKELNNFALRAAEEKNWDHAVAQLKEAIDLCNQCVQIGVLRKNIGLVYARKGDAEHARQELQLALKLLPEGPDMIAATQALRQLSGQPDR